MRINRVANGILLLLFAGTLAGTLASAQPPRPQPLPPMPASGGDLYRDLIIAQERAGLDALKSGNATALADTRSDDGIFVDPHGLARKPEAVKNAAGVRLTGYTMTDLRFVPVSAEGGVVSYLLTEQGTSQGKQFSARAFVSSVWVRSAGRWVCVLSQETPAQ